MLAWDRMERSDIGAFNIAMMFGELEAVFFLFFLAYAFCFVLFCYFVCLRDDLFPLHGLANMLCELVFTDDVSV